MQEGFINAFRSLPHPNLGIKILIVTFIKASWLAYNSMDKNISSERFQTLIKPLAYILFTQSKNEIDSVLIDINAEFENSEEIEFFFHNTFYMILNVYIKSLYGTNGQFKKIRAIINAMDDLILYALSMYNRDEDITSHQEDFLSLFRRLHAKDKAILVLNTYYGIPIQNDVKIVCVDEEGIMLKVASAQITAATYERKIHILKNKEIPYDIYAKVLIENFRGESVLKLYQFEYLQKTLYQRKGIRVHPLKRLILDVMHDDEFLKFGLYDLSLGGIAITSEETYSFKHSGVTLYFPEEIISDRAGIKASVIAASVLDEHKLYHAKIDLTTQQEFYLRRYISNQERAIIKKLNNEFF